MNKIKNQITLDECGATLPDYEKTHDFDGEFINKYHKQFTLVSVRERGLINIKDVFGFLFRQEALKLYEMAYFSKGNILEIGTHQGLSAFVMAHALRDARKTSKIDTYDVHKGFQDKAIANLQRIKLDMFVNFFLEDGLQAIKRYTENKQKFDLVFVDHDHSLTPNFELCTIIAPVVSKGGFIVFHDYNDARNKNNYYGVWEAVNTGLDQKQFTFYGIVGSMAIYRRA